MPGMMRRRGAKVESTRRCGSTMYVGAAGGRKALSRVVAALTCLCDTRDSLSKACREVTSLGVVRGKPVVRRAAAAWVLGVCQKASTAVSSDGLVD
jgi:hypothetical protein